VRVLRILLLQTGLVYFKVASAYVSSRCHQTALAIKFLVGKAANVSKTDD